MNTYLPRFQRTDTSPEVRHFTRLYNEIHDLLTGQQKSLLRLLSSLADSKDYKRYTDVLTHWLQDAEQVRQKKVAFIRSRVHPDLTDSFDELFILVSDLYSAQERIAHAEALLRSLLIDEMLKSTDEYK